MKKQKRTLFRLNPINQIILIALSSSPVWAATTNPNTLPQQMAFISAPKQWMPRVSITGEYGNYGVGQADLFTPVWSNNLGIVFFDLRATATAQSTQEYNGALGFRTIVGNTNKAIVGAHIWDDRKHTKYGNFFNQGTLGVEYFGNVYSVTSNLYVPYGDKKQVAYTDVTPFATGHTVGYVSSTSYETALAGIDIEIGKQDIFDRHLRVYGDYYHFGEGSDSTRMNGGRARSEYIIENKWLHQMDTDVMVTASLQYDNVQHAAGFLGLRVNIGRDYEPTDPLVGRLEEYIIRDNNIVAPIGDSSSTRVTDPDTFIFVDNTKPAGGDGTKEHPYNTETAAVTAAQSGNIIYTFKGAGNYTMPSGGLDLKQNLVFFGSGSNYLFNNVIVLPATSAPVLNGRINLADNDTINGFTVSGQGSSENIGIYGANVSHVSIINTTVQDFTGTNANGTNGTTVGGVGGVGGNAYGIHLSGSHDILLDHVTVNNIIGGDANGGSASAYTSSSFLQGGTGGTGGRAYGIILDNYSSSITLNHVSVSNIMGGDANSGSVTGSGANAYTPNAGTAGDAFGIQLRNSSTIVLNQVAVTNIIGGDAHAGSATGSFYDYIASPRGGTGGNSKGLYLATSSDITLDNVSVTNILGGNANGANAVNSYGSGANTVSYRAGFGGNAIGIDLTGISIIHFDNVFVSNIIGGDANAGNATNTTGSGGFSTAGNGGNGGYATGIKGLSSVPAGVTISGVTGGTATGGTASGSATNTQGAYGTAGTATNVKP